MNGSVLYDGNTLLSGAINVNTGGNVEPLNVNITENGTQTINAPVGVDGYNPITIETNVPSEEPVLDNITITENGTYTPPTGTDGYDEINVNVPPITPVLDDITITENGTYTPPSGVDGYDVVVVNVPLPENAYLLEEYEDVPTDIASFTASDAPLKSLTASIVPVQSGSGDPSPTNVRPITGWTEEIITVADDLQNPTVTHTTTIPFTDGQGQSVEVFGGSVDVVNGGEQPRTLGGVDMGTLDWYYNATNQFFRTTIADMDDKYNYASDVTDITMSIAKYKGANVSWTAMQNGEFGVNAKEIRLKFTDYTSTEQLVEAITGQTIVYPLATPTTFYTQPTSIKSLDGENNASASTGQIENLEYFTS